MSAVPADAFVKRDANAPPGFFEAEARGLRWLAAAAGGVPVAAVRDVAPGRLVLERLVPVDPTRPHAEELGRGLARTHQTGAPVWGREDGDGFVGPLPLPNGPFPSWHELWWQGRVEPYLRQAVDRGELGTQDAAAVERVVAGTAVPPDPRPSRLHGDLWAGNVVWTARGAVLVDGAAAHGGHREADLAMLALFGLPHLEHVLRAYDEEWPIAPGWEQRVPFWQLHPLLVHVVLFGGRYAAAVRSAATVRRRE
jgi:fructosamine-3-kinase